MTKGQGGSSGRGISYFFSRTEKISKWSVCGKLSIRRRSSRRIRAGEKTQVAGEGGRIAGIVDDGPGAAGGHAVDHPLPTGRRAEDRPRTVRRRGSPASSTSAGRDGRCRFGSAPGSPAGRRGCADRSPRPAPRRSWAASGRVKKPQPQKRSAALAIFLAARDCCSRPWSGCSWKRLAWMKLSGATR